MNDIQLDAVNCYLMTLAPSGRRSMRSLLVQAAALLGHSDVEGVRWHQLNYQQLVYIRAGLQEQGKSANTINTTLAAIRGVLKTAFKMGLVNAEQLARISQIENVRGNARRIGLSLTMEQARDLIASVSRDLSARGLRDSAIITLMLSCGLRRSEVVSLNFGVVDTSKDSIRIQGKGGKYRVCDISGVTLQKLTAWCALYRPASPGRPLFSPVRGNTPTTSRLSTQAIYRIVKERGEAVGLNDLRPHDLRRTLVTLMMEQGIDLHTVSQAAGHSSIVTTTRYDKRSTAAQLSAMRSMTALLTGDVK